jgi:hypothetical protein
MGVGYYSSYKASLVNQSDMRRNVRVVICYNYQKNILCWEELPLLDRMVTWEFADWFLARYSNIPMYAYFPEAMNNNFQERTFNKGYMKLHKQLEKDIKGS